MSQTSKNFSFIKTNSIITVWHNFYLNVVKITEIGSYNIEKINNVKYMRSANNLITSTLLQTRKKVC